VEASQQKHTEITIKKFSCTHSFISCQTTIGGTTQTNAKEHRDAPDLSIEDIIKLSIESCKFSKREMAWM
jgi:hypothetical protein